jgi:hypothetical protein
MSSVLLTSGNQGHRGQSGKIHSIIFFSMKIRLIVYVLLVFCFSSCIGGGTTGKIKGYRYNLPSHYLEEAVDSIFMNTTDVKLDSDRLTGSRPSETIFINRNGKVYKYVTRFSYWDTANEAELCIIYAYENGVGGDEGSKSFAGKKDVRNRLIQVFDTVVAQKIDSFLDMEHTDEFN